MVLYKLRELGNESQLSFYVEKMTINILGTDYRIEIHKYDEDPSLKNNSWAGYCVSDVPLIVIADMDDKDHFSFDGEEDKDNYTKSCLRHEITHAFLNESGLKDNSNPCSGEWAKNEEIVDWIAIQYPKMKKVFDKLGI